MKNVILISALAGAALLASAAAAIAFPVANCNQPASGNGGSTCISHVTVTKIYTVVYTGPHTPQYRVRDPIYSVRIYLGVRAPAPYYEHR